MYVEYFNIRALACAACAHSSVKVSCNLLYKTCAFASVAKFPVHFAKYVKTASDHQHDLCETGHTQQNSSPPCG